MYLKYKGKCQLTRELQGLKQSCIKAHHVLEISIQIFGQYAILEQMANIHI